MKRLICCHRRNSVWVYLLVLIFYPGVGVAMDAAAEVDKLYAKLQSRFKDAVEVTVTQLDVLQANGNTILIDTRAAKEQAVSMIPGAITAKQFTASPEKYINAELVAYCTIGYRSGKFAIEWRNRGYRVSNLKGGVLAWANAGGEFVTSTGALTKRVHVYDEGWSLLPQGYEAVW